MGSAGPVAPRRPRLSSLRLAELEVIGTSRGAAGTDYRPGAAAVQQDGRPRALPGPAPGAAYMGAARDELQLAVADLRLALRRRGAGPKRIRAVAIDRQGRRNRARRRAHHGASPRADEHRRVG